MLYNNSKHIRELTMVFKLFSDGNYFPRAKRSGFGGYIKNVEGEIIAEYSEQIKDKKYIQNFELLGIIRGLQVAKAHNIKHIVSHCDDKTTAIRLKAIFETNEFNIPEYGKPELFREIMEIAKSFESISFQYIPRAQNKYADLLSRKYALLLEKNFVTLYKKELQNSQIAFTKKGRLPKRIFFAHSNFVKILNRNNPYLVASFRNQRVRSITRQEEKKNYSFVFFETFIKDSQQGFKIYEYNQARVLQKVTPYQLPLINGELMNCATVLNKILSEHIQERLWVFSNHTEFNDILEQKNKIPTIELAENLRGTYDVLDAYKQVLYHHFPFEHTFSRNLQAQMRKRNNLKDTYDSLDSILQNLQTKTVNPKQYSKHVGNLIRYHLRNYQNLIQRDIKESEKTVIIKQTFESISNRDFNSNLSSVLAENLHLDKIAA